jgi:hypothetical protein
MENTMNDKLKTSAKAARELLEVVADGIGKLESGAGAFARSSAQQLARRLPERWGGSSSSSTGLIATLLAAGVVAGTAVLIYSRTKSGQRARKRSRR